ncbi:MAG: BatD family protein [Pseudomonadota bacterium]
MKTYYRAAAALLISSLHLSALAAVTAQLDQDRISLGESVRLIVEHEGNTHRQPDLNPLKQDFDILSRSSGSSIQIINGQMSAKNQITLILSPKHEGRIRIPALEWDGERSTELDLTVGSAPPAPSAQGTPNEEGKPSANAQHVFLSSTVDQKHPYVQAAVTLTIRLYTDRALYEASLELPPSNDVVAQPLGKDQQTTEVRNGKRYQVIERKYLLFPQKTGQLKLAGPVLNATMPDSNSPDGNDSIFGSIFGNSPLAGMINATRPIQLRGNAIVLNVQAHPSSSKGNWLPAQHVTLEDSWLPDTLTVHVGEPIVRHLNLSAVGLPAAQLPDVSALMSLPADIKIYPDQPKLENTVQNASVVGRRQHDVALIANKPGKYQLPAIHLQWWDTTHNIQREVVLPGRTLNILPGSSNSANITAQAPQNPTPPNDPTTGSKAGSDTLAASTPSLSTPPPESSSSKYGIAALVPWHWVSLTLGTLWLATLAAWWYNTRRRRSLQAQLISNDSQSNLPNSLSVSEARQSFQQACRANHPQNARHALLTWASAAWPHHPPAGLNALAQRLDDSQVKALLRELDRACYTSVTWDGKALASALTKLPVEKKVATGKPQLGSLYS